MSGKRQHVIPQFLQAGFTSHRTGDAAYAWVFRKGACPFNANIENIGVEGYFYTEGDDTHVDDLITDAEGTFHTLLDTLRTMRPSRVSDPAIPELIAHFEARTRHLRQGFLQAGGHLVSRMLDFLSDQQAFLSFVKRKLENDPSILRELFASELTSRGLPQALLEPMLTLSRPLLPAFMNRLRPQLPMIAETLRPVMVNTLKAAAKSGHMNALKKGVSPATKAERYRELAYAVVEVQNDDLVLGDSILLFYVDAPRLYKTFFDKGDVLKGVYLPLSPRRLLVGTLGEIWSPPPGVCEAIAGCSLEYFVAHQNSDANRLLAGHIGENAALITTVELEEIIASNING